MTTPPLKPLTCTTLGFVAATLLGGGLTADLAHATAVAYSFTGVLPSDAPTNDIMAPNASFALKFTLPKPLLPDPGEVDPGSSFGVVPLISYTLGGVDVPASTLDVIFFLNAGTDISFTTANGSGFLSFSGVSFYSGPETAPVLVTGINELRDITLRLTAPEFVEVAIEDMLITTNLLADPVGTPGDFNFDGVVNADDIDLFNDNQGNPLFDLDGDFDADQIDLETLVVTILNSFAGDANLNGSVSTDDLAILAGNFGASNRGWATGDFNADGNVGTPDLAILAGNFGQGLPPVQVATTPLVPEPASLALIAFGGLFVAQRRQR